MTGAPSTDSYFVFSYFPKINQSDRKSSCFLFASCLLFLICFTVLVDAAPYRSKSKGRDGPQLVYDQKQTGDYNIQLHLKDFQIIALLGDDSLGEYDYDYDYADFTVKPSGSSSTSTTPKPASTIRASTTTTIWPSSTSQLPINPSTPESDHNKPVDISIPEIPNTNSHSKPSNSILSNLHPYPIEVVVFEPTKKPADVENNKSKDSSKFNKEPNVNDNKDTASETSLNEILTPSSTSVPQSSTDSSPSYSSTTPSFHQSSSPTPEAMTPGKIKVQILEAPTPTVGLSPPSVGIVPGEDVQSEISGGILHGELASYRKCAGGFSRDKKGRCRRVRRPGVASQLPFGFGRIASNLATRLRLQSQETPLDAQISPEK